jgi:hypothetical protein
VKSKRNPKTRQNTKPLPNCTHNHRLGLQLHETPTSSAAAKHRQASKEKKERERVLTVEAGGELGDEREGDGEPDDERPVALGLTHQHLRQGPSHHRRHHLAKLGLKP